MFHTGSYLGLWVILLIIFSVFLIVSDYRLHYVTSLRSSISAVLTPIQYLADAPSTFYNKIENFFVKQSKLIAENSHLKTQQLLLQARLQKFAYLELDNKQLHLLFEVRKRITGKLLVAQLLTVEKESTRQKITLDKGSKDGVYVGQPIIDAYGVMGQVISVAPFSSTVLLITDAKSAIPVIDVRNNLRAIVAGKGNSEFLELINVPDTVDVKIGDVLVTSGIGFKLPEGYPVGTVKVVAHVAGERFTKIIVAPSAAVNRSQYVLLVWPDHLEKI